MTLPLDDNNGSKEVESRQEGDYEIPWDSKKPGREYLVENVQKIASIFQGRMDYHAEQQDDGTYLKVKGLTMEDWVAHLRGNKTLGVYPLVDGKVSFAVVDVDEKGPDAKRFQLAFQKKLSELGIPSHLEPSGMKGSHLCLVFKCLLPADKVRLLLHYKKDQVIEEDPTLKHLKVEIFPKQSGDVELGNLVKMPFGYHRVGKKWTEFFASVNGTIKSFDDWGLSLILDSPMVSQIALDRAINQIPQSYIDTFGKEQVGVGQGIPQGRATQPLPCFLKMGEATVPEGERDITVFRYAVHCYRQGLSMETTETVLATFNEQHCRPPLGAKIVKQKVKQAYMGKYGYGCLEQPIRQYCVESCPLYRRRHLQGDGFSPTDQQLEVEIDRMTVIEAEPPFWEIVILHKGKELLLGHLRTEDVENPRHIDRSAFQWLGFHPFKNIPRTHWIHYLDTFDARGKLKREEAPIEASKGARILGLIYDWLERAPKAETGTDAKAGLPIDYEGRYHFKIDALQDVLSRRSNVRPDESSLWDIIRGAGGGGGRKGRKSYRLEDGYSRQTWWLPQREPEQDYPEEPTPEGQQKTLIELEQENDGDISF